MRAHRIFLKDLAQSEVTLLGDEAHHLTKVLRVQLGNKIKAFDGKGLEAEGEVIALEPMGATLRLEQPRKAKLEPKWKITLAISLLKGDKLSNVIRQGTEIGVVSFIPLLTEHCKVHTLKESKLKRWQAIAQEAAKQSGRSFVPVISELCELTTIETSILNLVAHPYSTTTLYEVTRAYLTHECLDILCVTGPEGGFSKNEINILKEKSFHSIKLGARILRAETAPIALAAALLLPKGQ